MRKLFLVSLLLLVLSNILASELKSIHIQPLNSEKTISIINENTKKDKEYFIFCDTLALEYEVEKGYEVYGFVRTIASDELEPDLNIYLNDTLSMLLSVSVDKSVKYTSNEYKELSRAKKIYITPQKDNCKIRLSTSSKLPLMIRMYKREATLLNKSLTKSNQDLRI